MGDNKKELKKQLYPKRESKKRWKGDNDELVPAARDIGQIYCLIKRLINIEADNSDKKNIDEFYCEASKNTVDGELKEFFKNIYKDSTEEEKSALVNSKIFDTTADTIKVDLIKGSIYKIKKYFLEDNNLKDIRGGSMMIDYLNITEVKNIMNSKEFNFNEDNIIYCGGGNILIVVPAGYGAELCKKFEEQFTRISLTVMSAFEYVTCSLGELLFKFNSCKSKVENLVTERSKMKLYDIDPDPDENKDLYEYDEIEIDGETISFKDCYKLYPKVSGGVCELCHTRDYKYEINDEAENIKVCNSCFRKHIVGRAKSKFYHEYEQYVIEKLGIPNFEMKNKDKIKSIVDIGDEIAVIYGDGNNMGNVVKNIENIFEMMYFSKRTDDITKGAVYKALYNAMGSDAKFETIALGGDDIFIIVPAEYAFEIAEDIIENFDNEFNKEITMSIGIAISKAATPITSLFALAQKRLKSAKALVKNDSSIEEGTIDVIELIGDMHVSSEEDRMIITKDKESGEIDYQVLGLNGISTPRLFPMTKSDLKACSDTIKGIDPKLRTQLYKIGYAKENMIEEEFELFYFYQNSKSKGDNVYKLVKRLKDGSINLKDKFNNCTPYNIDWKELILMYERGGSSNEQNL